uniref:ribonucleoside-diphosphate reductase n=1 Tax=viral metagenome TaxID=1070528 RepID=A0A6C0AYE9_9ZZZZ|tara:strand:+ start:1039 stop:3828 length:2790 start_codon:yes stop_codon:yes gene_type:complete
MQEEMQEEMHVKKRNGNLEIVSFDKILARLKTLGNLSNISINYTTLVIKIIDQLYNGIETSRIDELTAQQAATMSTIHPDYGVLASYLVISNLHKKTDKSFTKSMNMIYNFQDNNNNHIPLLSNDFISIVNKYASYFDNIIDYQRDYLIDYFGFKTLERAYLFHLNKKIIERPQHVWLRVAICIHKEDINAIKETYDLMSLKYFTHATPTLFNAGTPRPQLSSCFLTAMESDSVDGIYNTLKECANISKWAGGIGIHIHNIRAKGSHIRGTNGTSNGIVPMLSVFNKTARYIDQGGGRRNGSFAIYIEPHHADIEDYLDLKKNHGDEELRARDLFYALWISNLFMERVKNNAKWSLFCPDSAPGLSEVYDEDYKVLYEKYEVEKKYVKQINARDLWIQILDSQMETGTPYMLYKDSINKKSNQKNLGTIKSSNLCCEITEYSDENETAVCNLASIALSKFIIETDNPFSNNILIYTKDNCNWCILMKALLKRRNISFLETKLKTDDEIRNFKEIWNVETVPQLIDNEKLVGGFTEVLNKLRNKFDYELLHKITKIITKNLNKVIDINFYPTEKTKRSNLYHRPIGIGVQGLADAFIMMDIPYDSELAKIVNKKIFETIYHAALEQSMELSLERNEDMNILRGEYMISWNFRNEDNDLSREYEINDYMNASSSSTITNETKISALLKKNTPIRCEIERETNCYGSYSSFDGSPASNEILQFDMWNISPDDRYDWNKLKQQIKKNGLRNSLLVAPMPTASTSQILGNNECFEPLTSNIYSRRTLAGEFILTNKYLIKELLELGIWNEEIKNNIILNKGSIQYIENIPKFIKEKYKIVWEIPMKHLIDMSKDRGAFICQSQSLNLWMEDPDAKSLTNMHFYAWNSGLKTGIYYLRRKPKHQPQQFTIEPTQNTITEQKDSVYIEKECEMCGS